MLNLIKYEFIRKSKLMGIFLAVVLILNAVLLIKLQTCTISAEEQMMAMGVFYTALIGVFFVLYIVDVTAMYSRDLDQKTGYMFFLTPNSGYKILGSKIAVGILEGFAFLLIYFLLFAVNIMGFYGDTLRALVGSDLFAYILSRVYLEGINLSSYFAVYVITIFIGIVTLVLMIFTAISIRKSILAERKFGGIISFIIFLLLAWLSTKVTETITSVLSVDPLITQGAPSYSFLITQILLQVVLGIVFFCISGYLLDKRMDL